MTEEIYRARWAVELLRADICEALMDLLKYSNVCDELKALSIAERRATRRFNRLYQEQMRKRKR